MKRTLLRTLCFILIASCLLIPVNGTDEEEQIDTSVSTGCHSIHAQKAVLGANQLISGAEAAFLYEVGTQTLMHAWNADVKMYPASLVKIITAYIACDMGNLDDIVLITGEMLATLPEDALSVNLQEGEILSLKDLLYCLQVGSANDAATAIACHISGNVSSFVTLMNQYAQDLGCTNSIFTNPHGLHDERQFTTARDITKILEAAIQNDNFVQIFQTARYTVPATNKSEARQLVTNNYLISTDVFDIYYDKRVVGARYGVTNFGTRCIAAVSKSNGLTMISVLFGTKTVYNEKDNTILSYGGFPETLKLIDYGFKGFQPAQVFYAGQVLQQKTVLNGANDLFIGTKSGISTVLPEKALSTDLLFRYNYLDSVLTAPIKKDTVLGTLEVWNNDLCVAETTLFAMNDVKVFTPIQQPQEAKKESALPIIILVVVQLIAVVFTIRLSQNAKKTAHRRKNRRRREHG